MRTRAFGALVLLFLSGCGGPGLVPIKTAPVDGTATFDGQPLENYRVFFFCAESDAKEPAFGQVKADGTFVVGVRKGNDGAIIGKNQIWLTYEPPIPELGPDEPWNPPPPKVKLPEKFLSRETSGLSVEVPTSGLKDYKIELK